MVDIVIPVYGGLDHLKRLLPGLKACTSMAEVSVFLVDDLTPEDKGRANIIAYVKKFIESNKVKRWELILKETNSGFADTNNVGASHGKGEFILMLNSDTVPFPRWLEYMLAVMGELPQVGAVGAKLIFPPWMDSPQRPANTIQHAGVAFDTSRLPYHIFAGWRPNHPKVNRRLFMQAVTGACLLTRRELWDDIGGLNPIYGQGNHEDIEYCMEIKKRGMDSAYCPEAQLFHVGSGSNNTRDAQKNAGIFLERWAEHIESDNFLYY